MGITSIDIQKTMHTQLIQRVFNLSVLSIYVPVNVFSHVGTISVFLYLTSTKKQIKCLAQ